MALVRFTSEAQDQLLHLFSDYSKTNPSDKGEERLQKFLLLFGKFNADLRAIRHYDKSTEELEYTFLKELVLLAYNEYYRCWKKTPRLCSDVLNVVGEWLGFSRKLLITKSLDPRSAHHFSADTIQENDKSYFLRIYQRFSSPIVTNQRLHFWTVGKTVSGPSLSAPPSPMVKMGYRGPGE